MTNTQLDLFSAPVLADQNARDAAIHGIDRSFVVSAGAGAGKTETLIRRLEQVLEHGGDPSRIVAITFTERAARDLVNKLRSKLPASMTADVERMTVGTIHSFCSGILRRHPLEAGLPPVFSTQDELLAGSDLHDRSLRLKHRMFEQIQQLDDPTVREAIDVLVAENGIGHLDALIALIDQQWDRFDELEHMPPPPWRPSCARALDRVLALASDPDVPLKLRLLIKDMVPGVEACLHASTMVEALALVPSASMLRSTGGGDGKPARDEVKACLAEVKSILYDTAVRHLVHVLVPLVLDEAHSRYQAGSLSFDDILVLTRRLLVQQPHICRRIRAEIDHLCVDEFQDTDVVQYDIVQALTAPEPDRSDGSSGPTLFAVGDPKQSIYGFREADVSLFARLHELPHLTPLQLTTNFRSKPAVLSWINEVFGDWFAADRPAGQVRARHTRHGHRDRRADGGSGRTRRSRTGRRHRPDDHRGPRCVDGAPRRRPARGDIRRHRRAGPSARRSHPPRTGAASGRHPLRHRRWRTALRHPRST
jgi:ATP-dependent helicase/nuclease subunit A